MAVFEVDWDFGVGVHEGVGERLNDSRAARTIGADEGDVLTASVGKSVDNLVEDCRVFGLLDFVSLASVASGEIDCKALKSGGVAKGEVTGDTAGVDVAFFIFDDTVEIIEPSNSLVKVVQGEFKLVQDLFVAREVFDDGDRKDSAGDGFGIGLVADGASGIVDRFGRSGEIVSNLVEKGNRQAEASHEKGATRGFGEDFGELGRGKCGLDLEQ